MTKNDRSRLNRRSMLAIGTAALAAPMLGRRANAQTASLTVAASLPVVDASLLTTMRAA